jgi:hypothetical protein
MDKSMSFREIKESELAEEASTSGHSGEENSLASMFSLSRSPTINEANMEIVEENPQAAWKLPAIDPAKVYNDLSMFHLTAITRIFVK